MLRVQVAFLGRPAWRLRPPEPLTSWCAICLGDVMVTNVAGEGGAAVPLARSHAPRFRFLVWRCPACGGLTAGDRLDGAAYPDLRLLPMEGSA